MKDREAACRKFESTNGTPIQVFKTEKYVDRRSTQSTCKNLIFKTEIDTTKK